MAFVIKKDAGGAVRRMELVTANYLSSGYDLYRTDGNVPLLIKDTGLDDPSDAFDYWLDAGHATLTLAPVT